MERLTTEIHEGAATVVTLRGEADRATLDTLCDALERASDSCPEKPVVADLRAVTLIDATGLSVLVETHKRLARAGCSLFVMTARGTQPERALLLGDYDRILNRIESLEEIKGLSGNGEAEGTTP